MLLNLNPVLLNSFLVQLNSTREEFKSFPIQLKSLLVQQTLSLSITRLTCEEKPFAEESHSTAIDKQMGCRSNTDKFTHAQSP